MRVTQSMIYDQVLTSYQSSLQNMNDLYSQLSSGNKFTKPSDDVVGYSEAQDYQVSINAGSQYLNNVNDATGKLSYASGLVQNVSDTLSRIQELTVQAANGTLSADDRASISEEVKNDREFLMNVANSQYEGNYIFSGFKTGTPAYDPATGTYQGDSNVKKVLVENNTYVDTTVPGSQVFDGFDGQGNIFGMLDNLQTALTNNDTTTIKASLDRIDAASTHVSEVNSLIGSRLSSLDGLKTRISNTQLTLQTQLSGVQDADYATTASSLNKTQIALTAMQQSAGKIINQSLLDFIK